MSKSKQAVFCFICAFIVIFLTTGCMASPQQKEFEVVGKGGSKSYIIDHDHSNPQGIGGIASADKSTGNILKPNEPVWTPQYQLPSDWQINLDNPEMSRRYTERSLPDELTIFSLGPSAENYSAEFTRDRLYAKMLCADTREKLFINCAKGFEKFKMKFENYEGFVLRYYGNWQSDTRQINEIFLTHQEKLIHIQTKGELYNIRPAILKMLETIEWQFQKVPSGNTLETEEKSL